MFTQFQEVGRMIGRMCDGLQAVQHAQRQSIAERVQHGIAGPAYRPNRAEYLALTHSGRILGIKWRF